MSSGGTSPPNKRPRLEGGESNDFSKEQPKRSITTYTRPSAPDNRPAIVVNNLPPGMDDTSLQSAFLVHYPLAVFEAKGLHLFAVKGLVFALLVFC